MFMIHLFELWVYMFHAICRIWCRLHTNYDFQLIIYFDLEVGVPEETRISNWQTQQICVCAAMARIV